MSQKNSELDKKMSEEFKNSPKTIHEIAEKHAKKIPNTTALIEFETGSRISYKELNTNSKAFAALLLSYGIKKGDVIATSLPCLKEHIYLWIACSRLGAILTPLDLRLKASEISENFNKIKPKMYFFLGLTPVRDFTEIVGEVMKKHHVKFGGSIHTWVQFQAKKESILEDAVYIKDFAKNVKYHFIWNMVKETFGFGVFNQSKVVKGDDPSLIIFTTGSTGSPKPALISGEGILAQSCALCSNFVYPLQPKLKEGEIVKMLVNLPLSHVGGICEQLGSMFYSGNTAILLAVFDAKKTLESIQKYKINAVGQIPALFALEWKLENFKDYDLSSLELGVYGGQSVSLEFLKKMEAMCQRPGTGLGATETSGLSTFTTIGTKCEEIMVSLGYDSPFCRVSIREPMNSDGKAGKELPKGETGEVCFKGVQVFKGYLNDEEKTKNTISKDGYMYSGDLGSYDETGLHFSSRRKFVIKPKGYQVNPHDVEAKIGDLFPNDISNIAIVGCKHEIYSEGVVACIKLKEESKLDKKTIIEGCKIMASYKRPSKIIFLDEFPLNRVAKTDYLEITKIAEEEIKKNGWD